MWDAILASVPEQPTAPRVSQRLKPGAEDLQRYAGRYFFSEPIKIEVSVRDSRLFAQAIGARDAYAIKRAAPVELLPVTKDVFTVPGRYPLTIQFEPAAVVLNPGRWQQTGARVH
jgi:hypothetical protein